MSEHVNALYGCIHTFGFVGSMFGKLIDKIHQRTHAVAAASAAAHNALHTGSCRTVGAMVMLLVNDHHHHLHHRYSPAATATAANSEQRDDNTHLRVTPAELHTLQNTENTENTRQIAAHVQISFISCQTDRRRIRVCVCVYFWSAEVH